MTAIKSVSNIFYGLVFENKELNKTLGYSYDLWLEEHLESLCNKPLTEKEFWKEKDNLKKKIGIEVIFYDGEEDINIGIAIKDSMFITCSGLADILDPNYLKVDKTWNTKLFAALALFGLKEEDYSGKDKLKPQWYVITKPEFVENKL